MTSQNALVDVEAFDTLTKPSFVADQANRSMGRTDRRRSRFAELAEFIAAEVIEPCRLPTLAALQRVQSGLGG